MSPLKITYALCKGEQENSYYIKTETIVVALLLPYFFIYSSTDAIDFIQQHHHTGGSKQETGYLKILCYLKFWTLDY